MNLEDEFSEEPVNDILRSEEDTAQETNRNKKMNLEKIEIFL